MLKDVLITLLQYLLPQHLMSRLAGKFANSQSVRLKNFIIRHYIRFYQVDMSEAEHEGIEAYADFNQFFTRRLKASARPLAGGNDTIICPADGNISQAGDITYGNIFQAKGHQYTVNELLGGSIERAEPFYNGQFMTVYLSPRDYHRVHMPITGTLREMIYVPGKLFSVQNATVERIPNLFARNERVVTIFETECGPMALVLVGAINVASIHTVWHGEVAPNKGHDIHPWRYPNAKTDAVTLQRGDEVGHFQLGSTAIVLFPKNTIQWLPNIGAGCAVKFGEAIAKNHKS